MPLQIRRGTEAERLAMTVPLAEGELLYVTDDQRLYLGGKTPQGVPILGGIRVTGYTDNDAKDAAALILTTGDHVGVGFSYNSQTKKLNATVDLSAFDGPIVADALKGSVFADDSSMLLDAIDKVLYGNVIGNVTGNLNGNVTGNILGNLTGNIVGTVTGNTNGVHTGDVLGSIFSDDSVMMVDGTNGTINGSLLTDVITSNISIVKNEDVGFALSVTALVSDTDTAVGIEFETSRGTTGIPTNAEVLDPIFVVAGKVWKDDRSEYVASTLILGEVSDTYGAGELSVPSKLIFGASNGVRLPSAPEFQMTYDGDGNLSAPVVAARTAFQLPVYANDTARNTAISTPLAGMMVFMTSGGTPSVTNAAVIYDGSAWAAL